jgi:hypothetical protein
LVHQCFKTIDYCDWLDHDTIRLPGPQGVACASIAGKMDDIKFRGFDREAVVAGINEPYYSVQYIAYVLFLFIRLERFLAWKSTVKCSQN